MISFNVTLTLQLLWNLPVLGGATAPPAIQNRSSPQLFNSIFKTIMFHIFIQCVLLLGLFVCCHVCCITHCSNELFLVGLIKLSTNMVSLFHTHTKINNALKHICRWRLSHLQFEYHCPRRTWGLCVCGVAVKTTLTETKGEMTWTLWKDEPAVDLANLS